MTRFYNFAAKLCGSLAGVCAILAVLAVPSAAWADDLSNCEECCGSMPPGPDGEYEECVSNCMQGTGECSATGCVFVCTDTCPDQMIPGSCLQDPNYCVGSVCFCNCDPSGATACVCNN